jgi:hypothetical protein
MERCFLCGPCRDVTSKTVSESQLRVQKEEFSITCYMYEIYTRRKAKHIHKRQTHIFVREVLHKDYYCKSSVEKSLVVSLKGLGAKTN